MANLAELLRRLSPITEHEMGLMSEKKTSAPIVMLILSPILSYAIGTALAVAMPVKNYVDCGRIPMIGARCADLMRYDGISHLFAISTTACSISLGIMYGFAGAIFYLRTCRANTDDSRVGLTSAVTGLTIPLLLLLIAFWFLTYDISISTKKYPGNAKFFLWQTFPLLSSAMTFMIASGIVHAVAALRKIGAAILTHLSGKA